MWISKRGDGDPVMWMIIFYNSIIKCQILDKGRGGGRSDNVDKDFCMF